MLEIKTDDGKGLRARAIVGNTSRCGVCDMVLLDGQQFFMLDDPYNCIVHNTGINFREWDGKLRAQGTDRDEMSKQISDDEQILGEYMRKAHWPTLRIPTAVRDAWTRFYFRGLMLRQMYDLQPKRDALIRRVATALNLLPAADLPPPRQTSAGGPGEPFPASAAPAGSAAAACQTTQQSAENHATAPSSPSPIPQTTSQDTAQGCAAAEATPDGGASAPAPQAFRGNVFAP